MRYLNTDIELYQGDITTLPVDAIVNAANQKLTGGGGVDGAIHRQAGPNLLSACLRLGGCETGEAKITSGFNLPAKFVIHTVGPIYGKEDGFEASYLEDCYTHSLELADRHQAASIAFPAISTGSYGYPLEEAASIALETVQEYLDAHPKTGISKIMFVCFTPGALAVYRRVSADIFP